MSPESPAAALARLYDLDLADDPGDVDLYLALAARMDGPVLELAVGTGRVAIAIARAGHRITGVDRDPAMLARARAAADAAGPDVAARVRLVEGDARSIRLPEAGSYPLAIIPLSSILLMGSRQGQVEALATLAAHLAPGGLAVVDAWIIGPRDLAHYDGRLSLEWIRDEPGTGRSVTKMASAVHDASAGTVRLTTIFDAATPGGPLTRWSRVDQLRLIGPDELAGLMDGAGLVVDTIAGDLELGALGPESDRVVVIARRP